VAVVDGTVILAFSKIEGKVLDELFAERHSKGAEEI